MDDDRIDFPSHLDDLMEAGLRCGHPHLRLLIRPFGSVRAEWSSSPRGLFFPSHQAADCWGDEPSRAMADRIQQRFGELRRGACFRFAGSFPAFGAHAGYDAILRQERPDEFLGGTWDLDIRPLESAIAKAPADLALDGRHAWLLQRHEGRLLRQSSPARHPALPRRRLRGGRL